MLPTRVTAPLRRHWMPALLIALTLVLAWVDPRPWNDWLRWLDAPALCSLLALLAVAQVLRESGLVQWAAQRLLAHVHSQRMLVLALMTLSACAAMLLTNDVSLFLVLPLALALCELTALPRLRVVALVALAVNAGSALSPIGNPQNLLLWRQANVGMLHFVVAMAPVVAIMVFCLLVAAWLLIPRGRFERLAPSPPRTPLDRRLAVIGGVLFIVLLALLEWRFEFTALVFVLVALRVVRRGALARLDWSLMVSIALMLLALGHLAALPQVRSMMAHLAWDRPDVTLFVGALLSQAVSNVPATVALKQQVSDPLWLAVAVNIGGSGLAIGSLANLIALRMEGSAAAWRVFHRISVPYFFVVLTLAWWWLRP
ncbi:citrate transporter [Oleiagrimonas citrea]|uniref:Citrate transporter n=1 Tax=Oleiagrimonas citrea TaxID=1665687 RepID=A0A846ZJG6_9GAMM|nr:citrate transporter [Oleiagrimonas citrea]